MRAENGDKFIYWRVFAKLGEDCFSRLRMSFDGEREVMHTSAAAIFLDEFGDRAFRACRL